MHFKISHICFCPSALRSQFDRVIYVALKKLLFGVVLRISSRSSVVLFFKECRVNWYRLNLSGGLSDSG